MEEQLGLQSPEVESNDGQQGWMLKLPNYHEWIHLEPITKCYSFIKKNTSHALKKKPT